MRDYRGLPIGHRAIALSSGLSHPHRSLCEISLGLFYERNVNFDKTRTLYSLQAIVYRTYFATFGTISLVASFKFVGFVREGYE